MEIRPLLKLARESILSKLENREAEIPDNLKKDFSKEGASFVTLTINKELRGCIGSILAHQPLWKDVFENARNAAFNDPRFSPLTKEEFDKIKIEVSVLTKPKEINYSSPEDLLKKIDKKMGIILQKGPFSATFLPQVWEQLPDKVQFLEHLSLKAGLPYSAWKTSRIKFYRVKSVIE